MGKKSKKQKKPEPTVKEEPPVVPITKLSHSKLLVKSAASGKSSGKSSGSASTSQTQSPLTTSQTQSPLTIEDSHVKKSKKKKKKKKESDIPSQPATPASSTSSKHPATPVSFKGPAIPSGSNKRPATPVERSSTPKSGPASVSNQGGSRSASPWRSDVGPAPKRRKATEKGPGNALQDALQYIHKLVMRRDTNDFFSAPVNDMIAPGYSTIIDHPMDLGTIRDKVNAGIYCTLAEYRSDLKLVCTNAMTYNHPETIYYKAAQKLLDYVLRTVCQEKLLSWRRSGLAVIVQLPEEQLYMGPAEEEEGVEQYIAPARKQAKSKIKHNYLHFEPIPDNLPAKDILALAEESARNASAVLDENVAHMPVMTLEENALRNPALTIINPDNHGILNESSRIVTLGGKAGALLSGTASLQDVREEDSRLANHIAFAVQYLNYGAFSSNAPLYDSSFSNLSKEESDLLLRAYGGDSMALEYAKSLQDFVSDSTQETINMADRVLDYLSEGKHSVAKKQIKAAREKKAAEEAKKKADSLSKVNFDQIRSLAELGIDISFVDGYEKSLTTQKKSVENAEKTKTAQPVKNDKSVPDETATKAPQEPHGESSTKDDSDTKTMATNKSEGNDEGQKEVEADLMKPEKSRKGEDSSIKSPQELIGESSVKGQGKPGAAPDTAEKPMDATGKSVDSTDTAKAADAVESESTVKRVSVQDELDASSSVLHELMETRQSRLTQPPPANLNLVELATEKEQEIGAKAVDALASLVKQVTPGDVVSINAVRTAMNVPTLDKVGPHPHFLPVSMETDEQPADVQQPPSDSSNRSTSEPSVSETSQSPDDVITDQPSAPVTESLSGTSTASKDSSPVRETAMLPGQGEGQTEVSVMEVDASESEDIEMTDFQTAVEPPKDGSQPSVDPSPSAAAEFTAVVNQATPLDSPGTESGATASVSSFEEKETRNLEPSTAESTRSPSASSVLPEPEQPVSTEAATSDPDRVTPNPDNMISNPGNKNPDPVSQPTEVEPMEVDTAETDPESGLCVGSSESKDERASGDKLEASVDKPYLTEAPTRKDTAAPKEPAGSSEEFSKHDDRDVERASDLGSSSIGSSRAKYDSPTSDQKVNTASRSDTALSEESSGASTDLPQASAGAPQETAGAPQEIAGAPQETAGAPQESAGSPQELAGAPQELAGAPQESAEDPQAFPAFTQGSGDSSPRPTTSEGEGLSDAGAMPSVDPVGEIKGHKGQGDMVDDDQTTNKESNKESPLAESSVSTPSASDTVLPPSE